MSLLLRGMIGIPLIVGLILVAGAGLQVVEPIYEATNGEDAALQGAEDVGWTDGDSDADENTMSMLMMALIALIGVVVAWIVYGSLRTDVRQRQQPVRRIRR